MNALIIQIKSFVKNIYLQNIAFENLKKKKPLRDSFLKVYGITLILFSILSFLITNVWEFSFFIFVGNLYYYLFFLVVFLKGSMLLEETNLIRSLLIESNWLFSPLLMFKTGAVAIKFCVTCVGGLAATGAAVDYRITELSGVKDTKGMVHKCSPSATMLSYAVGQKTGEELVEGVFNAKAAATKMADNQNINYQKYADLAESNKLKIRLEYNQKLSKLKLEDATAFENTKRNNALDLVKEKKKWS